MRIAIINAYYMLDCRTVHWCVWLAICSARVARARVGISRGVGVAGRVGGAPTAPRSDWCGGGAARGVLRGGGACTRKGPWLAHPAQRVQYVRRDSISMLDGGVDVLLVGCDDQELSSRSVTSRQADKQRVRVRSVTRRAGKRTNNV